MTFYIGCIYEELVDYPGNDIGSGQVGNQEACAKLSLATDGSKYWSFHKPTTCWLKVSKSKPGPGPGSSGSSECGIDGTKNHETSHLCTTYMLFLIKSNTSHKIIMLIFNLVHTRLHRVTDIWAERG